MLSDPTHFSLTDNSNHQTTHCNQANLIFTLTFTITASQLSVTMIFNRLTADTWWWNSFRFENKIEAKTLHIPYLCVQSVLIGGNGSVRVVLRRWALAYDWSCFCASPYVSRGVTQLRGHGSKKCTERDSCNGISWGASENAELNLASDGDHGIESNMSKTDVNKSCISFCYFLQSFWCYPCFERDGENRQMAQKLVDREERQRKREGKMWYQQPLSVKCHNTESNNSCFFNNNNNNNIIKHSEGEKKVEFQEIISFQGTESCRIWCHCLSDSANYHHRCWEWSNETCYCGACWCCYHLLHSWFQYIVNKYWRGCSH